MPPANAVTAVVFVAPAAATAAAATFVVVVAVVIINVAVVIGTVIFVVSAIVLVVVVIILIAVAAVVFAAMASAVVAIVAAAVAVAIATTTTTRLCSSRCWLVVALLSAVCFRHCTPSCDHQGFCRRPLLPPTVVHRRHRHRFRCRQATAASTATTVVKPTVVHCRIKRQRQQHHQRTNGSTNVKTFTSPDGLDLFNLSTVFDVCDVGLGNLAIIKLLAFKKMYLFCNLHTPRCIALRIWEVVPPCLPASPKP